MPALPDGATRPSMYYQYGLNDWRRVPNQEFRDGVLFVAPNFFGYYQLFAQVLTPSPTLGDVYVFPNPTVLGTVPTLHVDVQRAAKVMTRIYDVSGDLVFEAIVDTPLQTQNGKTFYEYGIDSSRFRPGAYFGVVTAEGVGREGTARRNFRFTIVK